jgi:hypothetical protein
VRFIRCQEPSAEDALQHLLSHHTALPQFPALVPVAILIAIALTAELAHFMERL